MTKEKDTKAEKNIMAVEGALSRTEHFIEKNQKIISYVIGALVIIIGGYMAFNKFYPFLFTRPGWQEKKVSYRRFYR